MKEKAKQGLRIYDITPFLIYDIINGRKQITPCHLACHLALLGRPLGGHFCKVLCNYFCSKDLCAKVEQKLFAIEPLFPPINRPRGWADFSAKNWQKQAKLLQNSLSPFSVQSRTQTQEEKNFGTLEPR